MKTTITAILVIAAFVLICSEPAEEANFIVTFLWTKIAGFACAYAAYKVAKSDGRLLAWVERFCRDDEAD